MTSVSSDREAKRSTRVSLSILSLGPRVSVMEGLKGDFFLVPRLRRTKFRALSPRCNPALNIQKRDRPTKSAGTGS